MQHINLEVKHLRMTQQSSRKGESNLRTATEYIPNFCTISGLACNIGETNVIPNGKITKTTDTLKMEWTKIFTIHGFKIDNKIANLILNFQKKIKKISKWKPYHL